MLAERYKANRNSSLSLVAPPCTARKFLTTFFRRHERPRTAEPAARPNRQKGGSDPICDIGIPETIVRESFHGKNLELRKLAPLPPFTSERFASELIMKLKQCQTRCNFEYVDADREAKAQKTEDLNDIMQALSVPANVRKFTPGMVRSIIKMTTSNIVRPVIRLDQKLIVMDELTPILDPVMEHLLIIYQILNRMLHCLPGNSAFNFRLLRRIIMQSFSPDEREREQIVLFAVEFAKVNTDKMKQFFTILTDVLQMEQGTVNWAFAGLCVLAILQKLIAEWGAIPKVAMQFFATTILPMFARPNFVFYKGLMTAVVTEFVNKAKQAPVVVNCMLRYWPQTRNAKNAAFLRMMTVVISRMYQKEAAPLIVPMFRKFADGTLSPSEKVAEAAIQNFSDPMLKQFLLENARPVFEIMVPVLKMTAETHWSMKIRELAKTALAYMSRLSTRTYKDVVSLDGAVPGKPNEIIRHQWANVIRQAGQYDPSINMGKKLSEVARVFSTTRNGYGLEVSAPRRGSVAGGISVRKPLPSLAPQVSDPRLNDVR